ncbi:hypothetical protein Btru_078111 [Bulinus truncatus]|nr:hypothetical protein Btru_078111 [Bulinus truncatus]
MDQQQYYVTEYGNQTSDIQVYPRPWLEQCERRYNETNSTIRAALMGFPNSTKEQFLEECFNRMQGSPLSHFIIIPYALIFLLSVLGNSLVILTLVRHKKMRTITNMYLLNLAISDLLLAVFCMPFTLISMLMQKFIFGSIVCFSLRYVQVVVKNRVVAICGNGSRPHVGNILGHMW